MTHFLLALCPEVFSCCFERQKLYKKNSKETAFPEKTFETRQPGQARPEWAMRPDLTRCGSLVSVVKKARKNSEVRCPETNFLVRGRAGVPTRLQQGVLGPGTW